LHLTVRERERCILLAGVRSGYFREDEELLQIAQSFSLWTPQEEEEDPGLPGAATRLSQTTARSKNESSLFRNEKRETKTETDVPRESEREREREREREMCLAR
jgi:hypothetical protein